MACSLSYLHHLPCHPLTDLLGLLIARIEDAPLGDVLERRIFGPLGMRDTGFTVPREKRVRRAGTYGFDAASRLMAQKYLQADFCRLETVCKELKIV